jgi:hypothetical protein
VAKVKYLLSFPSPSLAQHEIARGKGRGFSAFISYPHYLIPHTSPSSLSIHGQPGVMKVNTFTMVDYQVK